MVEALGSVETVDEAKGEEVLGKGGAAVKREAIFQLDRDAQDRVVILDRGSRIFRRSCWSGISDFGSRVRFDGFTGLGNQFCQGGVRVTEKCLQYSGMVRHQLPTSFLSCKLIDEFRNDVQMGPVFDELSAPRAKFFCPAP